MPGSGLSNFLLQNKYRRCINTAGHLGFRLVLYGYGASAKHRADLKPRCPAVLICMRKYIFSNAKDLYVLSLKVYTVKEMKTILFRNVYLRY